MNWNIYFIECAVLCAVFGALVFGAMVISPLTFISDYPPEIQTRYYETQHRETSRAKLNKMMKVKKLAGLIVMIFLFAWMAHFAGATSFWQGLFSVYGYMLILMAFDVLILDWLLFPNIRRIRLPGTEDMEKEYHQKWFHIKVMLPPLPIFAAAGAVMALVMIWIW